MPKKKLNIKKAIKRPGALTARAKRNGRTVAQQARHDKSKGTNLQKQQANFYLNTLRSINKKNKKKEMTINKLCL